MTSPAQARPRPQAPSNPRTAAPIPFAIAARRKHSLGFTSNAVAMSAVGANANLGPIEIPPTGFLRYVDLVVTGTTAANAATTVFAADAPFNAISYLTLTNAAGDTIIVPIDGYALYLFNKYGALSEDPPFSDPRQSPLFSTTAGVGAGLGGSFSFALRVPLEIDPQTAFGSIASMASNKSLQLGLQVAPTSAVYSTAPTTPPIVQVTGYQAFWAQPKGDNGRGVPQETVPQGNNSIQMWRVDTPAVTPGDKTLKINNVGNVLRMMIFVYRNAAGARVEADIPALHMFRLNNDEVMYLPDSLWREHIASAYGYTGATRDIANGLDTGVRPFHYFLDSDGRVRASSVREQYLPTLDTTLLQYRGTSFGAGISTVQIFTNEVKPTSSAALYQRT
jgi:hypothetical protein